MNWVSSLPSPNFASSGGELGTGGADECDELLDSGEVYRGIAIRAKSSIDPCDNPPGITRRCLLQSRTRPIRIKLLRTSTILQHIQLTYLRELGGLLGGRIWGSFIVWPMFQGESVMPMFASDVHFRREMPALPCRRRGEVI